jgi:hypothetical protein
LTEAVAGIAGTMTLKMTKNLPNERDGNSLENFANGSSRETKIRALGNIIEIGFHWTNQQISSDRL